MKQKKGISLIVLIITIIIMIIISGAIILTLTETNIIDKVENAVNKYNETELKQRVGLVFTEAQMAKYTDLEYSIEDNLKSIFEGIYGKDNITVAKSGKNYKVNVKDSKTTFRVKLDGSVEEYEEMDPTSIYARLDDEGVLYLRATENEGYNLYTDYRSIKSNWNTAGDATTSSVVKVVIEEKIAPTTTYSFFSNMTNLTKIENIQKLHTENVTDMEYMFYNCKKLEIIDLSNFDTSKVKNMRCMINSCEILTNLDLSNFDTSKVTKMANMFSNCKSLENLDLSNFDTINVKDMSAFFQSCYNIERINLSDINTKNVTDMSMMFADCRSLTNIDVSTFNTENVTNMNGMFANCHVLTNLDISRFDTEKVTSMRQMFALSKKLKTITLGENYIINDETDIYQILRDIPSDIKITATEATRDKLISASSLTADNFEIIN